ncbi:MAG: hypothetical protein O2960_00705 [Verrucomicrobia bacterium]|nr:hypothetical protein [Verrucomicrobiota bacterium]
MKEKQPTDPPTKPNGLANLIDLNPEPRALWNAEELGAILEHQLATTVLPNLSIISPKLTDVSPRTFQSANLTFGQALTASNPPIELLKLIKDFSKVHWHSKNSGLPKEVAMVLYYAAIASALYHGNGLITKLSLDSLKSGMQWVLDQNWVDDAIKAAVRNALDLVE